MSEKPPSGNYTPEPIDTSVIKLPDGLTHLMELLAKNAHEVWAHLRLREGWCYGSERNDPQKTHPCLVPYETLEDSEKTYDRQMAAETLKVILLLGYTVVPPDPKK